MRLTIDLVPSTAWNKSLAKLSNNTKWRKLKQELYDAEGKKCYICGVEDTRLEAHEWWSYEGNVQKLESVHHLCSWCHRVKHIGFWTQTQEGLSIMERYGMSEEDITNHFCKVNNCTKKDYHKEVEKAFNLFSQRSSIDWVQDFDKYKDLLVKSQRSRKRPSGSF